MAYPENENLRLVQSGAIKTTWVDGRERKANTFLL
tara:strand:- start:231 stop:335 length:105 start_codon:yes stop_codon:yes gene_type:complete